jgi:tRNA pseudouridine55 synthase
LKHQGIPLYKYARLGKAVIKPPRKVKISFIRIMDMDLPDVRFEVECTAGTYVRTLCADIGNVLGCGGHLKALRRTECGGYGIHAATPLAEIESHGTLETLRDRLISMSDALEGMPACIADSDLMEKIQYGKPIASVDLNLKMTEGGRPFIKIIDKENQLLAVVHPDETRNQYNYCCVLQSII